MPKTQNFLSKPEVTFWVPIIVYAVTLASMYWSLSGKIDLLTQKVEYFNLSETERGQKVANLQAAQNDFARRLIIVETVMAQEGKK